MMAPPRHPLLLLLLLVLLLLLLLVPPTRSCSVALISPFETVFSSLALTYDPNKILTKAYIYADGLRSPTTVEINLASEKDEASSLSYAEDVYSPTNSFLNEETPQDWRMVLTEVPPRWTVGFSTYASHRVQIIRDDDNETLVDLRLELRVVPGSPQSEIAAWVSEAQQATFLMTPGTLRVVRFDLPTNVSESFPTDVLADYSSLATSFDSVGVVYLAFPCCLCFNGAYYSFSATSGLTPIPVNIGSSVYDPRTKNWVDVGKLGLVTVFNLETRETRSFQLEFKAFNWRILAIALPSILVVLVVLALVGYKLFVHRNRLFRPHQDKPMVPLTSRASDGSQEVKEEA